MKKSKFREAKIAFILKQAEVGTPIAEVCRKAGISVHEAGSTPPAGRVPEMDRDFSTLYYYQAYNGDPLVHGRA